MTKEVPESRGCGLGGRRWYLSILLPEIMLGSSGRGCIGGSGGGRGNIWGSRAFSRACRHHSVIQDDTYISRSILLGPNGLLTLGLVRTEK